VSAWREGRFERAKIHGVWHPWTPARAVNNLHQLDLDELWQSGKRLILLDVDNTIVEWKQESFAELILDWMERAKAMGFDICLISNTNSPDRLERLRSILGVQTVRGRFKPSRHMFRQAMAMFNRTPEETMMVGDQLMTDILGANRSGIEAVWVRKMDGAEFRGTKINRVLERFFQSFIYRGLVAPVDEKTTIDEESKPLAERTLAHQIFRFVLVGGTSFAIDYMITMTLMYAVPWNGGRLSVVAGVTLLHSAPSLFWFAQKPEDAFFPFAATIAASVAILNSFIWNRFWTFEIRGSHERFDQLRKFVVVSLIGLILNVAFSTLFYHVLPFDFKWNTRFAKVLAASIVAVWNFTGQRFYAFRSNDPAE
jgi:HAD superfamily phosphatase (TIGR01668 family)